jgi:homoaconitate hydratase
MAGLTLVEKIATKHAVGLRQGQPARSGDIITIRPKHVMTHDNTSAVMSKFAEIFKGADTSMSKAHGLKSVGFGNLTTGSEAAKPVIHDPRQPVFAIDHDIQNLSPENLGKYAKIEAFAREHGIDFYPAGTGISHQVMVEYGYATPRTMVVGSDSHSNLYGAVNCLGTPVVRTDAAAIWATGETWWQVPPVARVVLTGRLKRGVVGKDVIIALCGVFNNDEVLNHAVEFTGDGIHQLSMDQRMSIANMTTEWGALAGVFPFDDVLREYLYGRADFLARKTPPPSVREGAGGWVERAESRVALTHPLTPSLGGKGNVPPRYTRSDVDRWWNEKVQADPDAHYAVELTLDLSTVIPHVSGPDDVKTMSSLPEIESERVKVNKAYLLSCVNARLEDLNEAASIVRGKKVARGVEFYVAAASANVQTQAEANGSWQALLEAGAIPLPSGCGPCIGLGRGTLEPGEVAISATNRNFKGRMGSREARAYLGSPAVVAASAIAGYICAPDRFESVKPKFTVKVRPSPRARGAGGEGVPEYEQAPAAEIIDGFPRTITGRAVLLPIDNLNTDGIYSGKLTYRDDVSDAEMAAACFNNYDPEFVNRAHAGDIVISGRNFGTGSSREQAATCLQKFGIPCVIAESFSETYKRNAFNNGFIVFECAALVEFVKARRHEAAEARSEEPTIVGPTIIVDFARGMIECEGHFFTFAPLSPTAQELVVAGGAENVVKRRLRAATR